VRWRPRHACLPRGTRRAAAGARDAGAGQELAGRAWRRSGRLKSCRSRRAPRPARPRGVGECKGRPRLKLKVEGWSSNAEMPRPTAGSQPSTFNFNFTFNPGFGPRSRRPRLLPQKSGVGQAAALKWLRLRLLPGFLPPNGVKQAPYTDVPAGSIILVLGTVSIQYGLRPGGGGCWGR